jgi:hypothetical protein
LALGLAALVNARITSARLGIGISWPFFVLWVLPLIMGVYPVHGLDGCLLRLRVANNQLDALKARIGDALKADPCRVVPDTKTKTGWVILRVKMGKYRDPRWGISAGEILHNLRAALDNLTWQVAHLNPKFVPPRTPRQFPIFLLKTTAKTDRKGKSISTFKKPGVTVQLKGIKRRHRTFFERQQPYKRWNGYKRDPLWLLKELNDADKHRVIHMTSYALFQAGIGVSPKHRHLVEEFRVRVRKRGFVDGAEVARFRYAAGVSGIVTVEVDHQFGVEIRFDDACGDAARLVMIKTLRAMIGRVGGIIASFAPLFP